MASSKTTSNSTWATPKTWATGDALTATNMNDELRDELNALYSPAHGYGEVDEAANVTIASTSWSDVDSTNLSMTVTTSGNPVLVMFIVNAFYSSGTGDGFICFDIDCDGTAAAGDDGIAQVMINSGGTPLTEPVTVFATFSGLTAASHTFKLRWKRFTSSTVTGGVYMGAGTSQHDLHPQMFLLEI